MNGMDDGRAACLRNQIKKPVNQKNHFVRDALPGANLWTNGLICAFELVQGRGKRIHAKSGSKIQPSQVSSDMLDRSVFGHELVDSLPLEADRNNLSECSHPIESDANIIDMLSGCSQDYNSGLYHTREGFPGSYWIPIGWARISELIQTVQIDSGWAMQSLEFADDENDVAVADVAAPYWECPVGPTWWCHVSAGHPFINSWLSSAQWLHPAISIALRDESRLISERMKYLLYEVPVRAAGGLLFELLGQSAGDPFVDEDDIPIVLRSWQAQNFLITALHIKGSAANISVLGIAEVQELLSAGGTNIPQTVHEIIAHLACRLARWDDRLFRKSIFGAADEVELKFMNRRTHEDVHLFSVILNQEIRRLSTQVIRVKWSLHGREEIVFELLQHLRGNVVGSLLEGLRKSTREMIEEQEAVRGRLFTIQDVMQSTVRSSLQDKSLRVTHNLGVFGGCGLVLSIITSLFGINVDGIPGANNTPFAFPLFAGILFFLGIVLIVMGLIYLGLKRPICEEQLEIRKLELQELVKMFQHEAESHAQVRRTVSRTNLPPTAADLLPDHTGYFLME